MGAAALRLGDAFPGLAAVAGGAAPARRPGFTPQGIGRSDERPQATAAKLDRCRCPPRARAGEVIGNGASADLTARRRRTVRMTPARTGGERRVDARSGLKRAAARAAPARRGACHRGVVRVDLRLAEQRVVDRDLAHGALKP